jgi:hypothetical protein
MSAAKGLSIIARHSNNPRNRVTSALKSQQPRLTKDLRKVSLKGERYVEKHRRAY